MWIRSQDKKKLLKVNNFYFTRNYKFNREGNIVWLDEFYLKVNEDVTVAIYTSEEKALKVLDMIEERLFYLERFGAHHTNGIVFQMPQDEDVI